MPSQNFPQAIHASQQNTANENQPDATNMVRAQLHLQGLHVDVDRICKQVWEFAVVKHLKRAIELGKGISMGWQQR
jgi:hypothetical protein